MTIFVIRSFVRFMAWMFSVYVSSFYPDSLLILWGLSFFCVASLYLHFSQRSLPKRDYLMRFAFFPSCLLVFLMCVFPSVLTSAKSCYYISGQSEGWFHSWRWLSSSFQWRWIGWWRRRWWLFWVCLCNLWQWWRAFVVCFLAGYWSWSSIFFGFALQNKSSTFYLFC